ncbi:MAG: MarR family transcriptional regulator [Gammaproteobacteria bacterium]|nr:MarR family transcriptional regulator [Gammaproteobacteria bacterium]
MTKKKAPFAHKEASDSSGFLLWQVTALWQRRIAAALRPHGLTQVQFALLASLLWLSNKEGAITQVMLARHAKLDVMMTSQVLRALETKGLIERQPHPRDTRAKILQLTKAGETLTWSAVPVVEKADDAFFAAVGVRRRPFNKLLSALIASAQEK